MKPNMILRVAALSATALAGCSAPEIEAEAPASVRPEVQVMRAPKEQVVLTRGTATTVAEPMPSECGCTAGNSKRPRYEARAECCDGQRGGAAKAK